MIENHLLVYKLGDKEMGQRLSPSLSAVGPPITICTDTVPRDSGGLLFAGGQYLYTSNDSNGVFAVRIKPDGSVMDGGTGIRIASFNAPNVNAVARPRSAFNGQRYLIVWQARNQWPDSSANEIYAARLNADGSLPDLLGLGTPMSAQSGQINKTNPAVVPLGSEFLVSWTNFLDPFISTSQNLDGRLAVYGTRVNAGGTVVGPSPGGFAISALPSLYPALYYGELAGAPIATSGGARVFWGSMPKGMQTGAAYSLKSVLVSPF